MTRAKATVTPGFFAWQWLVYAAMTCGCGGRVDLGGSTDTISAPGTETPASSVEVAAGTVTIAKIHVLHALTLVADEDYLYFQSPGAYETQALLRCTKSDCLGTAAELNPNSFGRVLLRAGRFGWYDSDGIQICDLPNCTNQQRLRGIESGLTTSSSWTFDREQLFWDVPSDRAIYRCSIPVCIGGPTPVGLSYQSTKLVLEGDYLYSLDTVYGILRTAASGNAGTEQLKLGEKTSWIAPDEDLLSSSQKVFDMAIDGPWIYATLVGADWPSNGVYCSSCTVAASIARWRQTEPETPRQVVLVDDISLDDVADLHVFDGEVVWHTRQGELWSCLADDCLGSKRQIGVGANMDNWGIDYIAMDERYIFWLSNRCSGGACDQDWNLKRTPRIPK